MAADRCRGVTEKGRSCRNRVAGGGVWCGRCRGAPDPPAATGPAGNPVAAALTPPAAGSDPLDAGVPTWTAGSRSTATIAADPGTDQRLLARLAARPGTDQTLMAVAGNPSTPPASLAALAVLADGADSTALLVRRQALRNPSCPPDVLAGEADRSGLDQFTRAAIANNPSTPPATLTALAGDRQLFVRIRVAHNPSTPPAALAELAAASGSPSLRKAVAGNPSCPPAALAELANDEDADVTAAARANPGFGGAAAAHAALLND